jgi:hypothetical protein
MSAELIADDGTAFPFEDDAADVDARRPHLSGDLPGVLTPAPMFRRTVAGYDRFQVDTYVRWAEDEIGMNSVSPCTRPSRAANHSAMETR